LAHTHKLDDRFDPENNFNGREISSYVRKLIPPDMTEPEITELFFVITARKQFATQHVSKSEEVRAFTCFSQSTAVGLLDLNFSMWRDLRSRKTC
jgi:hypothetical protein